MLNIGDSYVCCKILSAVLKPDVNERNALQDNLRMMFLVLRSSKVLYTFRIVQISEILNNSPRLEEGKRNNIIVHKLNKHCKEI